MKQNTRKVVIGTLAISLIAALGIGGTLAFLTDSEQVTNHFSMGDLDITLDEPSWNDGGNPDDDHHQKDPSESQNPSDGENPEDSQNPSDGEDSSDPQNPSDPENPSDPSEPDEPGDGDGLVPGDSRDKDPTVTAVSGDSYMRVVMLLQDTKGNLITDQDRIDLILTTIRYAENDAIKEGTSYSLADIASYQQINTAAFTPDEARSSAGVYYYNYNGILKSGTKAELFTDIVIPTDWGHSELNLMGKYQIVLQAQAIQSANFDNAADAFAALDGEISNGTADQNYQEKSQKSDQNFAFAELKSNVG